jgi:hypothetical protein
MNVIEFFKYRYCRAKMVAYLHGELTPEARGRIARYIDGSPACYAEYLRQRDTVRELTWKIPLVGQPDKPQLDNIWSAIQAEMKGHTPPKRRVTVQVRYGFAGMVLALTILMPFTMGNRDVQYVPSQPAPHTLDATAVADASGLRIGVTPQAAVEPKATPEVAQITAARK